MFNVKITMGIRHTYNYNDLCYVECFNFSYTINNLNNSIWSVICNLKNMLERKIHILIKYITLKMYIPSVVFLIEYSTTDGCGRTNKKCGTRTQRAEVPET